MLTNKIVKADMFRLNPELFKDKLDSDMVGDLGYPGLLRYFVFKEVKRGKDSNLGEIVFCSIGGVTSNIFKDRKLKIVAKGELIFPAKDLITITEPDVLISL